MQPLRRATKACVGDATDAIMNGIPPVMWFWRQQMCARRERGVSVEQFRVLTLVDREAAASLTDVATFTGSSLPAASRLVARLVDRDYLTRDASSDDRRRCALVLTDRGRRALRAAQAGTREAIAGELSGTLSGAQCDRVAEAMKLLDGIFTAARDRGRADPPPARRRPSAVAKRS